VHPLATGWTKGGPVRATTPVGDGFGAPSRPSHQRIYCPLAPLALHTYQLFFHLGYMGSAPDNLPDSDAMRLRACIHATPHMQARHPTANTRTCTNT
jgi:hypothetical protein